MTESKAESDRQLLVLKRQSIIYSICRDKTSCLESLATLKTYLKDYNLDKPTKNNHGGLYQKYIDRVNCRVLSSNIIFKESSVGGVNNMSTFRFNRMFNDADKRFHKISLPSLRIASIVCQKLFDGNLERYEEYMIQAINDLNFVRSIFECHHEYNESPVDEVTGFQPIFLRFLNELTGKLGVRSQSTTSSHSNDLTRTLSNGREFFAYAANRFKLSFTAECCTENPSKGKTEKISGYTDVVISKTNSFHVDKSAICLFELKPPEALYVASNVVGPKNQTCAQMKGIQSMYSLSDVTTNTAVNTTTTVTADSTADSTNVFIPRACLTDLYSLYCTFLFQGEYYITESVLDPRAYLERLLFQLCDLTTAETMDLIDKSELTAEDEILTDETPDETTGIIVNPVSNLSMTQPQPQATTIEDTSIPEINYKLEEEIEVYNDKVSALYRWENEMWGYGHLNKENLEKYDSGNSNFSMLSRYLDTENV